MRIEQRGDALVGIVVDMGSIQSGGFVPVQVGDVYLTGTVENNVLVGISPFSLKPLGCPGPDIDLAVKADLSADRNTLKLTAEVLQPTQDPCTYTTSGWGKPAPYRRR